MPSIIKYITPKSETCYISENSTIRQALEKMDYYKFAVVPLIDQEGKFVGTISEGDILRYIKNSKNFNLKEAENTSLRDIEKYRNYVALKNTDPMSDVLSLLLNQNFIPLIDDRGVYIGIVKRKTILTLLYEGELTYK